MIFGWTQIIMDIQPLIVLITGKGHLHGFSHTYIGAFLIAIFSAVTGKYLSEFFLVRYKVAEMDLKIHWLVALISAVIGSTSHVVIDSIMHSDMQPFAPFFIDNQILGLLSIPTLHKFCLYSGLLGALIFYTTIFLRKKLKK